MAGMADGKRSDEDDLSCEAGWSRDVGGYKVGIPAGVRERGACCVIYMIMGMGLTGLRVL